MKPSSRPQHRRKRGSKAPAPSPDVSFLSLLREGQLNRAEQLRHLVDSQRVELDRQVSALHHVQRAFLWVGLALIFGLLAASQLVTLLIDWEVIQP